MPGMRGFGRGMGRGFGRGMGGHRGFGGGRHPFGGGLPGLFRPMMPGFRPGRILRRNSNWLMIGSLAAILLAGGATAQAIKLSQEDLRRVEEATGKPADELTEEELLVAMRRLGIQRLDLSQDDMAYIEMAKRPVKVPNYCPNCGAPTREVQLASQDDAIDCAYCGTRLT